MSDDGTEGDDARPRTDPDDARLRSFLSTALGEEVVGIDRLDDALNEMLAVETVGEGPPYVLRRPKGLRETELFVDLETEYRVLEGLEEAPLPTPRPVAFCDDESVLGDRFFVTTFLEGEYVPMHDPLSERFPTPEARERLALRMVDALADLHSVDPDPFEAVCERQTPAEQVDRSFERLDRTRAATGREVPRLREVGERLRRRAPADPRPRLVHGDFKPGNLLVSGSEDPEVTGVLDWETASLADPRTELGYFLLYWRDEGDPLPALEELEARHGGEPGMEGVREIHREGFYPFTTAPGSPSRRDLVERYERRTGIDYGDDAFYRAHAAFMLATVWEDLHRIQVESGAGSESEYPPLVEYAARTAALILGE